MGFMLGFGFQAWLLGLKPMGFGFRPPHVKPLQGAKRLDQSGIFRSHLAPTSVIHDHWNNTATCDIISNHCQVPSTSGAVISAHSTASSTRGPSCHT